MCLYIKEVFDAIIVEEFRLLWNGCIQQFKIVTKQFPLVYSKQTWSFEFIKTKLKHPRLI